MKRLFFLLLPLSILLTSSNSITPKTKPEKLMVVVMEEKNILAAGTKYRGNVFVYRVPDEKPAMFVNGKDITVDENGVGAFSFTATGGTYDKEGNSKRKYDIKAQVNLNGKDTILNFRKEYIVKRPYIEYSGVTASALYKNCGNEINIQIPALEETYNPSFRAEGAMVIPGAEKGRLVILPVGAKVKLSIASGGDLVGEKTFLVREIPDPKFVLLKDSVTVDRINGMHAEDLGILHVRIEPDYFFATAFPKDARYRLSEVHTSLRRLDKVIDTLSFSDQNFLNLSAYKSQAKKGDRIVIEIQKVSRVNFLNKVEVTDPKEIMSIPIY